MLKMLQLPAQFTVGAAHLFAGELIAPDLDPGHKGQHKPRFDSVSFDFSKLKFIDGAGLTVLCNVIRWLRRRGVRISFINHKSNSEALRYLDDCGFFERHLKEKLNPAAAARDTSIPAVPVTHANSFEWIEFKAGPWMAQHLNVPPENLAEVRVCIKELFNNIKDHTTEDEGFVHIQLYPREKKLTLTIADCGRGIPATMGDKFKPQNDAHAIEMALREGVTTKEFKGHCGAGLATLSRYVAIANKGRVDIYSGYGNVTLRSASNDAIRREQKVGTAYFPGTLFNLEFRTNAFAREEVDTGGLSWE